MKITDRGYLFNSRGQVMRFYILFLPFLLVVILIQPCWAQTSTTLITYGADAKSIEGDDDFKQVIFFTIPKTTQRDSLYLRIFDPDVGGAWDQQYGEWDSQTRFRLYGGEGAYTAPSVRTPWPKEEDRLAGNLITDITFGVDKFSDNKWFTFANFSPALGEEVGGNKVFKLVIEGVGTKVLLAQLADKYDTIGVDGVAMAVNDVIRSGATPLALVDNFHAHVSDPELVREWLKGIVKGAIESDCPVPGGEIGDVAAIIKGLTEGKGFDLIVASVGDVIKEDIIRLSVTSPRQKDETQ